MIAAVTTKHNPSNTAQPIRRMTAAARDRRDRAAARRVERIIKQAKVKSAFVLIGRDGQAEYVLCPTCAEAFPSDRVLRVAKDDDGGHCFNCHAEAEISTPRNVRSILARMLGDQLVTRSEARRVQDRADLMLHTARRREQHILTVNGVLCCDCAPGAAPENFLRRVEIGRESCYNCDEAAS